MKIAVIGGGASGLCAAIMAKRTNGKATVTLFEKNPRVGKKLLVTGNGRCNITNVEADELSFNTDAGAITIPALREFDEKYILGFFKELGVYCHVEDGRVYPLSNQASTVLDSLRFECDRLSVETVCDTEIKSVKKDGKRFILDGKLEYDKVIIACGGKSSPVQGSNGSGAKLLEKLGHTVTELRPALVPLVCRDFPKNLKGVRQKCFVKVFSDGKELASSFGEVQFTDYGVSGIPVMDVSRHADFTKKKEYEIRLDCAPSLKESEIKKYLKNKIAFSPDQKCESLLTGIMNKQLGIVITKNCGISQNDGIYSVNAEKINSLVEKIKNLTFIADSNRGFDYSQVTAGGAKTNEFNPSTLESKKVKGLYACGEVLDVDAKCGGFNLQWAWSSGLLAGESAAGGGR